MKTRAIYDFVTVSPRRRFAAALPFVLVAAMVGCSSSSGNDDSKGGDTGGKIPAMNTPSDSSAKPPADGAGNKPDDSKTDEPTTPDDMMAAAGAGAPAPGDDMKPDDSKPGDDMMAADGEYPDIRGVGCSLDTGFPGDEVCLAPPKEGEGMQLHVGPANYDDPAEVNTFVFHPGQESSQCWTIHTPNTDEIYYQGFVMSGRPGTHHIINTAYKVEIADGGFTVCMDGGTGTNSNSIGNLPGASKAYMPRRPVAPENAHLGRAVPANTPMQADMHYFNFTDADILREFWMNIYYIDRAEVQEEPIQIRGMGGFSWMITPGTDHVYQYTAPITADGRIIELLGHYHAHGKRFTAYIKRATGEQQKVFEMYDYLDPAIFDYNTVTKNPDFSDNAGGAFTGVLDVKAGDTLQWVCNILNDSDVTLRYTNQVKTGEMCNIWGSSVGPKIDKVTGAEIPFAIE
jgi:hypothetical protein